MEFGVLGPLVVKADRPLHAPGKERSLLVVLLLNHGQVVPSERLVDELWGEDPPAAAVNLVQQYVSRLRRRLRAAGADPARRLFTRPPGYVLHVEPGELDAQRFEELVRQGSTLYDSGRLAAAVERFREAERLWRGRAFVDVPPTSQVTATARWLEELRLSAVERRVDAELALGRHSRLIEELTGLVAAHPLHERFRAQLMRVLYRSSRQSDALRVFREGRTVLVEQLGIEPGRELRELERAILAGIPLDDHGPVEVHPRPSRPPRRLPPRPTGFVGRVAELAQAEKVLASAHIGQPAVLTVTGMPGVGKTAFAVTVGHRAQDVFPDGQLFLTLGGSGTDPVPPRVALERLVRQLGGEPPEGADEEWLGEHYQRLLAGRRILVLLDDVADEAQVRPLLPAAAGCGALVTGRSRLPGLEGAQHVVLDVLTDTESVTLLRYVAGHGAETGDRSALARIAERCGGLPLALWTAGVRLATEPQLTPARLARRLAARPLTELRAGDLRVRDRLAAACRASSPSERAVLCRAAWLGAVEFEAVTVADALGGDAALAEAVLDRLVARNLIQVACTAPHGAPRYRLHPLLRLVVTECAGRGAPQWSAERTSRPAAGCTGPCGWPPRRLLVS